MFYILVKIGKAITLYFKANTYISTKNANKEGEDSLLKKNTFL